MDKTDIILIQLLLQNSRLPYRELAEKLDLSVNAVHKRIQKLRESGILRAFTAKINLSAFEHAVPVTVWGRSETRSVDETLEKLGKNSSIYWVSVAGGNYLYVGAYLQNISELEPYIAFVKKEAQIPDPTVGIAHEEPLLSHRDTTLYPLDYQIVYALHKNSRKPVSDVAEELGVSAKTVRRRLSRMIREGLIELSIEWYPDASNDIMTIFHLHLKASADKSKVGPLLIKKYSPNAFFLLSFSNLPNLLLCVVWTNTMKELQDIREVFERKEVFEFVVPNVLHIGFIFDTWRDELVFEKGAPTRRTID